MVKDLHARGINLMLWISDYCWCNLYSQGLANGYLFSTGDRTTADFRNPNAYHWFQTNLNAFVNLGVLGYKIDRGDEGEVPDAVQVRGRLDPLSTMATGSFIVPVVGTLDARPELRPAAGEVERIMWVPLAELTRSDTFREELWELDNQSRSMFFFELDDETVWGATARVLADFLAVLTGTVPPEPAW
jgi:hypothetical protein